MAKRVVHPYKTGCAYIYAGVIGVGERGGNTTENKQGCVIMCTAGTRFSGVRKTTCGLHFVRGFDTFVLAPGGKCLHIYTVSARENERTE